MHPLICALGLAPIACAPLNKDQVSLSLNGYWLTNPHTVEFCNSLKISKKLILKQFDWWAKEVNPDYTFEYIQFSDCRDLPGLGVIRFDNADPLVLEELGAAAYTGYDTYFYIEEDPAGEFHQYSFIFASTIYLRPENSRAVIRHEIGHAWGWSHAMNPEESGYYKDGHLMAIYGNSNNFVGLENWPPAKPWVPTSSYR